MLRTAAATQIAGSTSPNQSTDQNESLLRYRTAKAITETGRATAEIKRAVDIALKLFLGCNTTITSATMGAILPPVHRKWGSGLSVIDENMKRALENHNVSAPKAALPFTMAPHHWQPRTGNWQLRTHNCS
jgi:hypothetical protein